jgi:hypothetical protein
MVACDRLRPTQLQAHGVVARREDTRILLPIEGGRTQTKGTREFLKESPSAKARGGVCRCTPVLAPLSNEPQFHYRA